MPPCGVGDGADDREAEAEASRRGRRAPRTKRSNRRGAQLGRDARSVVLDGQHDVARRRAASATWTRVPGGVWRSAFSIRLSASRCSSSRAPSHDAGLRVERRSRGRRRPAPARRPPRPATCARSTGSRGRPRGRRRRARAAAGRRRGGACAARSAAPSARPRASLAVERLGQQLEVGEHARQRRAQLVRGVGDELRAGARASPRSRRARRRARASMPSSVRASSATSSSAVGWGTCGDGSRVRSISRARRGQRGDRRHRAARDRQPGEQRQRRAAEHAEEQEERDARDGRLDVGDAAARTGRSRCPIGSPLRAERASTRLADAVVRGPCASSGSPARPGARRRRRTIAVPSSVTMRIDARVRALAAVARSASGPQRSARCAAGRR